MSVHPHEIFLTSVSNHSSPSTTNSKIVMGDDEPSSDGNGICTLVI